MICMACGTPNPTGRFTCAQCGGTDFRSAAAPPPTRPPPVAPEPHLASARVCWNCGHAVPDAGNTRCLECGRSLTAPAVVIRFRPGSQIEADRGAVVELGRDGPHAALFRPYRNVSHRHAILSVDAAGTPWLEPIPTAPNGTFVNDHEIPAGERFELRDGVEVRFAATISGRVTVFTR